MSSEAVAKTLGRLDVQPLHDAMARGRGALVVLPHFGSWEMGGVVLRRLTSYPLTVIAMRETSEVVNQRRRAFRDALGIDTIEVGQGLDTALRIRTALGQNRVVAVLVDRHVDKDRVAVQFFGRRAYFLRTPALIAYMSGAPLLPTFVYRDAADALVVESGPLIEVSREGDREAAVAAAMQLVADAFAHRIRQRPECWYQFYEYWSSQTVADAT